MFNIVRFYNQNRIKIWIIVITIIFGFTIIQILNKAIKENNKNQDNIVGKSNEVNVSKYTKESESMVSGGSVMLNYQDEFGDLLDNFLKYCINEDYDKAYDLLSDDCKETLYKSEDLFITGYCNNKFTKLKKYNFQSWSSAKGIYIYLVKIFDDMLVTGKDNTQNYIQDYLTIVKEDGNYKINVGGFIGKENINKKISKNGISINVLNSYIYMDYQIYDLAISNTTNNNICISSKEQNDIYLLDENETKFNALISENTIDDFILKDGEKKYIKIKFNASYRSNLKIKDVVFENVIKDYDDFKEKDEYKDFEKIEIEF